jgi:hypothetical protein
MKECKHCGNPFIPNTTWQKFCSTECKNEFNCQERREAMKDWREHKDAMRVAAE